MIENPAVGSRQLQLNMDHRVKPGDDENMDTAVKTRTTKKPTAKARQDLRAWIAQLRASGELQDIKGAEREKEIGGIVDIYQRRIGNKAVLFDDVPGFPRGHRILANILTSVRRINITLGLPPDASAVELVHYWRRYMKEARAIRARHGEERAGHGQRAQRQGHRHFQNPGAALARA